MIAKISLQALVADIFQSEPSIVQKTKALGMLSVSDLVLCYSDELQKSGFSVSELQVINNRLKASKLELGMSANEIVAYEAGFDPAIFRSLAAAGTTNEALDVVDALIDTLYARAIEIEKLVSIQMKAYDLFKAELQKL